MRGSFNDLPGEMIRDIGKMLKKRSDLAALNRLNKKSWNFTCCLLWGEVHGVDKLFTILFGENPLPPPDSPAMWDRDELLEMMDRDWTRDSKARFKYIAAFVHTLYIEKGVLPRRVHIALFELHPLLPNLQNLYVSRKAKREWEWDLRYPNDVEDLTLLFIHPSVKRVSVYCRELAIDAKKLWFQAPHLVELRLGCNESFPTGEIFTDPVRFVQGYDPDADPANRGVRLNPTAAYSARRFAEHLHKWASLETLKVNGAFIQDMPTLDFLARMPALRRLEIINPGTKRWSDLASGHAQSATLTELVLHESSVAAAEVVLRCADLLANIQLVALNLIHGRRLRNEVVREALRNLANGAPKLQELGLYWTAREPTTNDPCWSEPEMPAVLGRMRLSKIATQDCFRVLGHTRNPLHALLGAGEQLTSLDLRGVIVPVQLLCRFAQSYAALLFLRCVIDHALRDADKLEGFLVAQRQYTPGSRLQPIELNACFRLQNRGDFAPAQPGRVVRYLRDAWPNVKFVPDWPSTNGPEEVKYLSEVVSRASGPAQVIQGGSVAFVETNNVNAGNATPECIEVDD